MQSSATTVAQYIAELPPERAGVIKKVRALIKKNLPKGYREGMSYGMIGYFVPLTTYPKGYGGNAKIPLPYLNLASQKNYFALYWLGCYGNAKIDKWFRAAWKATGKKLDMGMGCIRFKKFEDLPLDVVAEAIAKISVRDFIAQYEAAREKRK